MKSTSKFLCLEHQAAIYISASTSSEIALEQLSSRISDRTIGVSVCGESRARQDLKLLFFVCLFSCILAFLCMCVVVVPTRPPGVTVNIFKKLEMNVSSSCGLTWIIKKKTKKQKTKARHILKNVLFWRTFKLETQVEKNFQLLFFLQTTPGCPVHVIVLKTPDSHSPSSTLAPLQLQCSSTIADAPLPPPHTPMGGVGGVVCPGCCQDQTGTSEVTSEAL